MEITIFLPKKVENALLKKAADSGQDIKTVVEQIVEISVESQSQSINNSDLENDMLSFADGTDNVPSFPGSYTRSEFYSDHD